MNEIDEPVLGGRPDSPSATGEGADLRQRIAALLRAERYAILCTQGRGQPYGSMVAFAPTADLGTIVFSTPTTTRKFRLLSECNHIALVFDNRSAGAEDMTRIEAVTGTGKATRVERPEEFASWSRLLVGRHPYLRSFVHAPSCALFRVEIVRYLHVVRFQEVRQWIPPSG